VIITDFTLVPAVVAKFLTWEHHTMPGLPNPIDHPDRYCAALGATLTGMGVWVPPDERGTDAERVHELLSLMQAWLLGQFLTTKGEVGLGALTADRTLIRTYLCDRHTEPADVLQVVAELMGLVEVLLGPGPNDGLAEVVQELAIAMNRTLAALLTPAEDAERPELVRFDDSGSGKHEFLPSRLVWLTEALTSVQSASAALIVARSS
jgi:hypothetical protein